MVFERVDPPRAHEIVAEQIRRQVGLRLIRRGDVLPPERELARTFGVGRATVQQALRELEADGLVESRRGRHGGTFVRGPAPGDPALAPLLEEVRATRGTVAEALAFRSVVEPAAAALAAERRDAGDLERLRLAVAGTAGAGDDDEAFMRHDTAFHLAVGEAARNRFLAESIERERLELNRVFPLLPTSAAWHSRSASEHATVLAALEASDADAARAAMAVHVGHSAASVAALLGALQG
jgi:GntR family transcriptional regulator, transcriptional repressor for pyruvate dehydrogenase complex